MKLSATVMVMLASVGHAADKTALVWVRDDLLGHKPAAHETVPARTLQQIYYLGEPCPLPLVDTRGMHLSFSQWNLPARRPTCWFATLDKGFTTVWSDGQLSHASAESINFLFVPAMIHDDGSATILEKY